MLSRSDICNLKNWKYQFEDHSLSSRLLTPYWNWCLDNLSVSVYPNLLTLLGLNCLLIAFTLSQMTPQGLSPITSFIIALMIFAYQTFDALDGKQARKTETDTCFGELLDHVVDAIASLLITS